MTNSVVENKTLTAYQLSQLLQRTAKKSSSTIFLEVIDPRLPKITGLIDIQLKSLPMFMDCVNKSELTTDDMATALISKMRVAMEIFEEYCNFCKLAPNLLSEPKENIEKKIKDCDENFRKSNHKGDALNYHHALEYSALMMDFIEVLKLTKASLTQSLIEKNISSGPGQNKVVYFALRLDELLEFSKDIFSNIAANAFNIKPSNRK